MAKHRGHRNGKKGQLATKEKEIYIKKKNLIYAYIYIYMIYMVKVTYNLKTQSFASQNLIMCVGAPEARRHQIS